VIRIGYGRGVVTFAVDTVEAVTDRLPAVSVGSLSPDALVVGGDPARQVLVPNGVHPLLSAVGRAFADHRPLVLSPDAVWLTIAQGLAQHVRLNAEQLRSRLVGHAGRECLEVALLGPMPDDAASWEQVVALSARQLAAEVEEAALFVCDFSTSTQVERTASQVLLLDAYSPYFTYWMKHVCGIPTITLTGTVADWQRIRERLDQLPRFGLDTWRASLVPIIDQFVRAACGEADVAFWQRIYNPDDAYGGAIITGWVVRLYPYLLDVGMIDRPNPMLDLPIDEPRNLTDPASRRRTTYRGPGVRSDDIPATLSRVVLKVNDQVSGDNRAVALHAGLLAVAQRTDGALEPVAGWHLAPAIPDIDDVADRLIDRGQVSPPPQEPPLIDMLPAEAMALYQRIGSAAELFDGAWHLLPIPEHRYVYVSEDNRTALVGIAALADGRTLAAVTREGSVETSPWVVCKMMLGEDPDDDWLLAEDPAAVPVYGRSLAMILDVALESGGDIAPLQTGHLGELPLRSGPR